VRVVANLPYSVASPLLRRLLDLRGLLRGWLVLVQREVAARLVAAPGSRDYGSLTVLHRLCARVERVRDLAPGCFHPVPQVTSTLVRVTPWEAQPAGIDPRGHLVGAQVAGGTELDAVERVVRAAFGTRRKTLLNALRTGLVPARSGEELHATLVRVGVDPRARAETLSPETFLVLARALAERDAPDLRAPP
jgi:16S rRNA (adenine1518-N6/adenine1519-N6)-dimethyltransferase